MNSTQPVTLSLGSTDRRDHWWIEPLLTALGLGAFVIYATLAAGQNAFYSWGPYLSPFYSPLIQFSGMPSWLSPAFLILGAPAGFRATCYYYRKAYYRSFFLSPPACAVGKGRSQGYTGERAFPFIMQNLHRFFLYLAILFVAILAYDAVLGFWFNVDKWGVPYTDGHRQLGMGFGSLVLVANVVLLSCYTFGCHSLRHLIGGKIDCFSCQSFGKARHGAWEKVSWLNQRHMLFAWLSLFTVGFADLYIRLVAMGVWTDFRFF